VHILYHKNERPPLTAVQAYVSQDCQSPGLTRLRVDPGQRSSPLRHAQQRQQIGRVLVRRSAGLTQTLIEFGDHCLGTIRAGQAAELPQEATYRPVGRGLIIGQTVPLQIFHRSIAEGACKLIQQPRLADAGLADDPHHLPLARLDLGQECLQRCQFTSTSNKWTQEASAPSCHP
jgi:hypothetical protein